MREHTLWVPIKPRVKPRPRLSRNRAYTPEWAMEYERAVGAEWELQQWEPFEGPVTVDIEYFKTGSLITVGEYHEDVKGIRGDLDNFIKASLDALNSIAWLDDKQVMQIGAAKRPGDAPPDAH